MNTDTRTAVDGLFRTWRGSEQGPPIAPLSAMSMDQRQKALARRFESGEAIVCPTAALRGIGQAIEFALRCEAVNAPDRHCSIGAEHRGMLEANLAALRALLDGSGGSA